MSVDNSIETIVIEHGSSRNIESTTPSLRDLVSKDTNMATENVLRRVRIINALKIDFMCWLGYAFIGGIIYLATFLSLGGEALLPGGALWSIVILFVVSHVAGYITERFGAPPVLGMIVAGLTLRNSPYNHIAALPEKWGEVVRGVGLGVILVRSGLDLDTLALKKVGFGTIAKLTCIPGILEAFASGLAAMVMFDMPFLLAISTGFILAAVSPAVVVGGMLDLQERGYGVKRGIPSLVLAAASMDDVVAISGFSLFIGAAIKGKESSNIVLISHGPLTIIYGLALGCLGGACLSATKIWNRRWKRTVVILCLSIIFMFGMSSLHFEGSGALASIVMGIVASMSWRFNYPKMLSLPAEKITEIASTSKKIHETESDLAQLWTILCQPLLFGIIGASIDFQTVPIATLPKSLAVLAAGLIFRIPAAYFSTTGRNFSPKERIFIALAWTPKATVQAALSTLPLELILKQMSANDPDLEEWLGWGNVIISTSVLAIIITAPLGLLLIQTLGPKFLHCDEPNTYNAFQKETEELQSLASNDIKKRTSSTNLNCLDGNFNFIRLDGLLSQILKQNECNKCKELATEAHGVLSEWKGVLNRQNKSQDV